MSRVAESPLLSADAQQIVIQGPELELTSLTRDIARHRLRRVCMAVRFVVAFTLSGDATAENQNELLDELLDSSPSHRVIDVLDQQDIKQLYQVGDVQGVASALETDTENGIQSHRESNARRQQIFGSNRIEKPPPKVRQIVLESIKDPIIIILLLCAMLSLAFGVIKHGSKGWPDGGGIFATVFVVIAVTAYCKIWTRRQIFTAQWSMLSKHCCDDNQVTHLEMELHKLAMIIAKVGLVVAFLVLVVLLIRYFMGNMHDDHGKQEFLAGKTSIRLVFFDVIGIIATPLAIASTAIPEGLLLAVIIPIAYSTNRMAAAQKALVRKLSAWEEIGSATVICTNERGNLTTKKLEVSRFWYGQETFSSIASNVCELLRQGVVSVSTEVLPGSSTESIELAIREWTSPPMNPNAEQNQKIRNNEQTRANCTVLHQKGGPEGMLAKCSLYYDESGNIKEITNEIREILKGKILEMKSKFPQCIGFSCSDAPEDNRNASENIHPHQNEKCFTLIGVAGLISSCPPEIKEAVDDCQRARVNIILVARSELPAATTIAIECGILDPNEDTTTGQVVDGEDFQNYPKKDRLEKSDKIRVMARATTLAKRYLVEDLKEIGHVVAVTGDSIRDAAVLKEANVGLSLGIQGTNIDEENSDIIILNDSFESIVTALRWGRAMYCKIQTYTQFQLTVSISSLVIDFVTAISASEPPNIKVVATISAGKAPFAALQVLWAKLIVGVLAALAITTEEPAKKLQQLPSVKKTEQFMANIVWKNIVGQTLYPIITLLTINFKGESVFNVDPKVKDTMIFNIFVLWQVLTILTTKRYEINDIKGIQREKLFWAIVGSIIFLQVVIVEVLERFAGTKRLNWMQWAECIGVAVLAWPIGWIVRRCLSSAPEVSYTYI